MARHSKECLATRKKMNEWLHDSICDSHTWNAGENLNLLIVISKVLIKGDPSMKDQTKSTQRAYCCLKSEMYCCSGKCLSFCVCLKQGILTTWFCRVMLHKNCNTLVVTRDLIYFCVDCVCVCARAWMCSCMCVLWSCSCHLVRKPGFNQQSKDGLGWSEFFSISNGCFKG